MKKKVDWVKLHKRFANGEQYLYVSLSGEIETENKTYYWQERGVYNHVKLIVEIICDFIVDFRRRTNEKINTNSTYNNNISY